MSDGAAACGCNGYLCRPLMQRAERWKIANTPSKSINEVGGPKVLYLLAFEAYLSLLQTPEDTTCWTPPPVQ